MKRTSHSMPVPIIAVVTIWALLGVLSSAQEAQEGRRRFRPSQQQQSEQDLFGDAQTNRQLTDQLPTDQPKDSIALTVWVLTIGDAPETPDDEVSVDFTDRVSNLPSRFESVEQVRQLVDQLKVAGMLRKAREFRLTTLDGQRAEAQAGSNRPRIVATNVSQQPRGRVSPPRPRLDTQGPTAGSTTQTTDPPEQSDAIVTNSITYEQIGTMVQLLPRIDSTGSLQVQLTYNSSDTEKAADVTLIEMPGRKPLTAEKVVTHQIQSAVRLKSGTAVVLQTDSSQAFDGELPTGKTQIVILAASVEPAIE